MHLVPSKPFQFVGIDSLSEGLLSNKRSHGEFLSAPVKPRQHFSLNKAPEAVRIRCGRPLILLVFAWVAGQLVRPPRLGVLAQCRQSELIGIVALRAGAKELESLAR